VAAYDHESIARRWLTQWDDDGTYRVDIDAVPPVDAFFNGLEFPYPSGDGLHVGHVFKYAGADVVGRYHRMCARSVFQPMGFDSFGIHTENYALRVGEHPEPLTARTVARFAEQLRSVALGCDWSRRVVTSDPAYYRWTQWVFLRLFAAGLAYRAEAPVLWCPSCLTVLAREQVDNGRCERCDAVVIERELTQWFLRTTAYRDRLRDGLDALDWPARAKNLQRRWLGGLHDWLVSRQRYWGTPIPIVHCDGCGTVPVPDDQLPVVLPAVADFRPSGSGASPLAAVEEWVAVDCPACGAVARRETDVLDTFVDSSWYFLRYPSTDVVDAPWSPERTRRWLPVDFYAGGPEHVTRHHLYARFVTMALHDLGLLDFSEPFPTMRLGGLVVLDGAKMSKSRGNVVSPDDYIARHGADALRVGLLFSARWDEGGDFHDAAVVGAERFLHRVARLVAAVPDADEDPLPAIVADTVAAVTTAIETLAFNVAIARLMELRTALAQSPSRAGVRTLVLLLAPFAPILAEELWEQLGGAGSVHHASWPTVPSTTTGFGERNAGTSLHLTPRNDTGGLVTNLWVNAEHSAAYLERADRIPNRAVGYGEVVAALPVSVGRVLDLGTGDGRLLAEVLAARPDATGVAVDFSDTMLAAARQRFAGDDRVEVMRHDLDEPLPDVGAFDAVVSSFAIHHCGHERKQALYREVFERLRPGGLFANLEHVSSPTERLHRAFMAAAFIDRDDPSNKLLDVETQLGWLRAIGFVDVDCLWKWRELALLAGYVSDGR